MSYENGRRQFCIEVDPVDVVSAQLDIDRFKLLHNQVSKKKKALEKRLAESVHDVEKLKKENKLLQQKLYAVNKKNNISVLLKNQSSQATLIQAEGNLINQGMVSMPSNKHLSAVMRSFVDISSHMKMITEDVERTMSTLVNACGKTTASDRASFELVRKYFLEESKKDEMVIPVEEDSVFFKGPETWYGNKETGENSPCQTVIPPASEEALEKVKVGGFFYDKMVRNCIQYH